MNTRAYTLRTSPRRGNGTSPIAWWESPNGHRSGDYDSPAAARAAMAAGLVTLAPPSAWGREQPGAAEYESTAPARAELPRVRVVDREAEAAEVLAAAVRRGRAVLDGTPAQRELAAWLILEAAGEWLDARDGSKNRPRHVDSV